MSAAQVSAGDIRIKPSIHLVVDFVECILQLSVNRRQFLEVSVGLVDRQQDLVHFIYGLVHCGLREHHNGKFAYRRVT